MMDGETVEIPFVKIGNRRGITAQQMMELPWVADFYRRFPHRFETCFEADAVLLIEPAPPVPNQNGG